MSIFESLYRALNEAIDFETEVKRREEKRMREWIPVTERLPKVDENGYSDSVLVTILVGDDDDAYNFVYIANWCEVDYMRFWRIGEEVEEDVVAWMPLPKPWRGEAKDGND